MPTARPLLIMVAGPYTAGGATAVERQDNLRRMNEAALVVLRAGHVPVIGVNLALPIIELAHAPLAEEVMPLSLGMAARCDGVLRIGGPSAGADREVAAVRANGGRVFERVEDIPRV